ncbi:hypothetical protein GCM10007880_65220 [Mesorhizobium amorphae]|nr:hypothetical protein GCM10007880_65220 [Mesorhizobium amorphae]
MDVGVTQARHHDLAGGRDDGGVGRQSAALADFHYLSLFDDNPLIGDNLSRGRIQEVRIFDGVDHCLLSVEPATKEVLDSLSAIGRAWT